MPNEDINEDDLPLLLDERQRRGALVLRTLPILSIPVVASIITWLLLRVTLLGLAPPDNVPRVTAATPLTLIVVAVIFLSSLIILVRLGRPTLSALALIGAWTLAVTVASLRFGVVTYFPALLILPICAAGLLIDATASISLAGLATVMIISLAWLENNGLVAPTPTLPAFVQENLPVLAAGFWGGLFWAVAGLTSLLAGGLQRALRQARTQTEALSQLSNELESRVQAQTAALLEQSREAATLEERTRLARDIHDTLAQGLTGIVVQLGAAQRAQAIADPQAAEHLDLAQRMAREALAEARRSVWNLRAAALERGDLSDALAGLVTRAHSPTIAMRFEQHGEPWPLLPAVESALLRVCQEALANVSRHADASAALVTLDFQPEAIQLSIEDNGAGFGDDVLGAPPAPGPWGGFGLLGMRERIGQLGGKLILRNRDGAQVIARVPRDRSSVELRGRETMREKP